jgi:hypothetical protein
MRTFSARRVWQSLGIGIAAMLVVGLLQAAVAVQAQEPNPEDPLGGVPVRWYVNSDSGPIVGPTGQLLGMAETDVHLGWWNLNIDWASWDLFWTQWQLQHGPESIGPVDTGMVVYPIYRPAASVTLAAGIWEPDLKNPFSPSRAFEHMPVHFWEFDPMLGLTSLGMSLTNGRGDARCPVGSCPYAAGADALGMVYQFEISLAQPGCPGAGPVGPGTIPHAFTVHGQGMRGDFDCLKSLGGQAWNCEADNNCEMFN